MMEFAWDMSQENFRKLMSAELDMEKDASDREYLGGCFVGDIKFEFYMNNGGCIYADPLIAGFSEEMGGLPMYGTVGGKPFFLYDSLEVNLPRRRVFDRFAEEFERRAIAELRKEPEVMQFAYGETRPEVWYMDRSYQPTIIRRKIYK